jgi:tRNA(Ser,Leu) C12 N-acetylase TAN1
MAFNVDMDKFESMATSLIRVSSSMATDALGGMVADLMKMDGDNEMIEAVIEKLKAFENSYNTIFVPNAKSFLGELENLAETGDVIRKLTSQLVDIKNPTTEVTVNSVELPTGV